MIEPMVFRSGIRCGAFHDPTLGDDFPSIPTTTIKVGYCKLQHFPWRQLLIAAGMYRLLGHVEQPDAPPADWTITGLMVGLGETPAEVRQRLSWPPAGHGEGYDMTGLRLENVNLRSVDGGRTWRDITGDIPRHRRNWSTPVVMDPNDNRVLYYGAARLWRSMDAGRTWQFVSDELPRGYVARPLLGTISTIAVAPSASVAGRRSRHSARQTSSQASAPTSSVVMPTRVSPTTTRSPKRLV